MADLPTIEEAFYIAIRLGRRCHWQFLLHTTVYKKAAGDGSFYIVAYGL